MKTTIYNIIRCWVIGVGCWMLAACSTAVENAKQEAARPDTGLIYIPITLV